MKRKVRVPDVTDGRSSGVCAHSSQRESTLASKQADRLAPLTDARIIANDAAYRDALGVKRIADAIATTDQAIAMR